MLSRSRSVSLHRSFKRTIRFRIMQHRLRVTFGTVLLLVLGTCFVLLLVFLPTPTSTFYFLDFGTSDVHAGVFKTAAIATDAFPCASVARDILNIPSATSMDAAIAGLLCNGVVNVHSMGIGGGFFMVIYDEETRQAYALDARETAPGGAHKDMFGGNASLSQVGALAIAIPGELHGYYLAHKKFGKLPWSELFKPSIKLLQEGVPIGKSLATSLVLRKEVILADEFMKSIFVNPATGDVFQEGDTYKNEVLANTFRKIATLGYEEFYTGTTAKNFVAEIQQRGGIITEADLRNYRAEWREPIRVQVERHIMYGLPPPNSGALLAYMLNIMDMYNVSNPSTVDTREKELLMWHRFVEGMKWAYARRSFFGDPFDPAIRDNVTQLLQELTSEKFAHDTMQNISDKMTSNNPQDYGAQYDSPGEDHGTAHLSIKGKDGLSISVTSTINIILGSRMMSPSTGILFNDQMDGFSSPNITNNYGLRPYPANYILPGKRPFSSTAPSIFVNGDTGKVKLVIGGAGGPRITTSVAYAALRFLWLGQSLKESIDAARLHHQLFPMELKAERGVPEVLTKYLSQKGHAFSSKAFGRISIGSVGSEEDDGRLHAMYDYRKPGEVAGLD